MRTTSLVTTIALFLHLCLCSQSIADLIAGQFYFGINLLDHSNNMLNDLVNSNTHSIAGVASGGNFTLNSGQQGSYNLRAGPGHASRFDVGMGEPVFEMSMSGPAPNYIPGSYNQVNGKVEGYYDCQWVPTANATKESVISNISLSIHVHVAPGDSASVELTGIGHLASIPGGNFPFTEPGDFLVEQNNTVPGAAESNPPYYGHYVIIMSILHDPTSTDSSSVTVAGTTFGAVQNFSVLGDFNGDHVVDAADYVVWRKSNGSLADYNLWRTNFGVSIPGSGSSVESASVPEPSTFLLLAIGAISLLGRSRRRRNFGG